MPEPPPDYRHILDAIPVSVVRLNRGLRVAYANAHLCLILGRPAADVIGRTGPELGMEPDHWGPWEGELRRVFETGRPGGLEYLCRLGDGERFMQYRFTPEVGPDGAVESVLAAAVTNDEVRKLRIALRDREALFDAFMDRGPMIAWMRDEDNRYVYLNALYLNHYGLKAEDILGKTVGERWPADAAARFAENDREVRAAGRPLRVYELAPEPDGTTHTWLNVKFPFADDAGRTFVGGVGIDITDRVRAEQEKRDLERQLLQAQKAESLGVLAGGVAHDFNNLLTVILGNAGMGLRNTRPDDPVGEHLRQIEQAAGRAAELCQQMLAYAGRGRLVVRDLNLSDLVRDTAGLIAPAFPTDVELVIQLPPDLPPVRADATQLRQVVLNLLTNAADALGGAAGTITVCTESLDADPAYLADAGLGTALPPGRYVALHVTDTGCGMDDRTRARVFDPFYTTKPEGRGLGLAAVLGIVRGHRGGVAVSSAPGQGSTFRVLLPVAGTADISDPHGADGVPIRFGRARTVLVVDPDEESRRQARAALDRAGFSVLTADPADAADAVRRLPGQVAAAVVQPTGWPGGAEEAVRTLKDARYELPVLLLVSESAETALSRLPRGSVAGCLRKPLRSSDLLELVFDVVGP